MTVAPIYRLYEITSPDGGILRLTNNYPIQKQREEIYINKLTWNCASLELSGVEKTTDQVAGIKLKIKFPNRLIDRQNRDNIIQSGSIIKRIITDTRSLEHSNFTIDLHPHEVVVYEELKIDIFVVDRIENQTFSELECLLTDQKIAWNQIFRPNVPGRCYHKYRGKNCGYSGNNYFNSNGETVDNIEDDVCGLRVKDCELRFPESPLRFGGIPNIIQNQRKDRR